MAEMIMYMQDFVRASILHRLGSACTSGVGLLANTLLASGNRKLLFA